MDTRWEQFDGLRVFAMLVIIASHTGALGMYGQGSVMVSLFFVLSGFFCVQPMTADGEERFCGIKGWLSFYALRVVRIIPVYWLVLVFFYWISDTAFADKTALFQSMFFVDTYGHLWYLQHEMVCYAVAPAVIGLIGMLKKKTGAGNGVIAAGLLAAGILVSRVFFTTPWFCLMWNGEKRQLRLGLFIIGMAAGYLVKCRKGFVVSGAARYALDGAEIVLMLTVSLFTSARFLSLFNEAYADYYFGWYKPITCALICAALVFLVCINNQGIVAKMLSLPLLTRFGRVTYGVYLVHFFLIEFMPLPPLKQFAMVTLISYAIAYICYEWIEEPLYRKAKGWVLGK
ncbi:MAG: acyltransferase [Alistipes sp.]|nr:acyltransferase [Alistipes sp.]